MKSVVMVSVSTALGPSTTSATTTTFYTFKIRTSPDPQICSLPQAD